MWMKVTGLLLALTVGIQADTLDVAHPPEMAGKSPEFKVFNDKSLHLREYGFGVLGGVVTGALGFYIGSGLESAIQGKNAKNGTLEFTGIRYDHFHGAFYGGGAGLWLGSALTAYFVGAIDEEDGSTFWTLFGGAASTAAAMGLASALGVNDRIDWPAFLPLVALPSAGAVLGYNVSRYFRDKRRAAVTGSTAGWQPPKVSLGWMDQHSALKVDALVWTFR